MCLREMMERKDEAAGFMLRVSIGILFTFAGIFKLFKYAENVKMLQDAGAKTFIPDFLMNIYAHVLPFAEAVIGLMLLLGLFTNLGFILVGLLLISLFFGSLTLGDYATASNNAIYILIAMAGFRWIGSNPWSLDNMLRK